MFRDVLTAFASAEDSERYHSAPGFSNDSYQGFGRSAIVSGSSGRPSAGGLCHGLVHFRFAYSANGTMTPSGLKTPTTSILSLLVCAGARAGLIHPPLESAVASKARAMVLFSMTPPGSEKNACTRQDRSMARQRPGLDYGQM